MNNLIMTNNAINYSVKHLFKIANPKNNIKTEIVIDDKNRKIEVNLNGSYKKVIFNLVEENEWNYIIQDKDYKINWTENWRSSYRIPVLFWANGVLLL